MTLVWRGDELLRNMKQMTVDAMLEIGLRIEREAKAELQKGHGVLTGTLRRSIHTATPGYSWEGDDCEPSEGSPELSGTGGGPEEADGKVSLQVGSGMEYAMAVHQGHGSFEGYHYLDNAVEKVRPEVDGIVQKHVKVGR